MTRVLGKNLNASAAVVFWRLPSAQRQHFSVVYAVMLP